MDSTRKSVAIILEEIGIALETMGIEFVLEFWGSSNSRAACHDEG